MAFTPTTAVYLCGVPLEKDQKNQLDFASSTAQHTYFSNKIKKSYTSFTYQRKDSVLRVPAEFDELYDCNYVMYQNADFGTKWFYCFIDHMEYVNPNCTAIYLKTDVFQTWLFDWTLKSSFVAREHVADDTPWAHTLAEPINKPEYIYSSLYSLTYDSTPGNQNTAWRYCVYATPDNGNDKIRPADDVGGTYVEYTNYTIGHMRTPGYLFGTPNLADFKDLIAQLIQDNYNISYTITLPASHVSGHLAVKWNGTFDTTVYPFMIYSDPGSSSSEYDNINLTAINTSSFGGHTVRNKKLNCYPYRYLQMTDDTDQKIDLKYELLSPATSGTWNNAFKINKTAGSAPAAILTPGSYAGKTGDFTHSVTLSSFPPVPYAIDYFQQYLALHKSSFAIENIRNTTALASGLVGSGAQAMSGNEVGAGFQAANTILNYESQLARYEDMANHPPAAHNAPSGEPKYFCNAMKFRIYDVYGTPEYLNKIDNFFDFYGYNVSTVKVPQFTSRPAWNYIETREINIDGGIPQDDMQEIKSIFNRGLTVWHDPSHFLDYTQSNAPTP